MGSSLAPGAPWRRIRLRAGGRRSAASDNAWSAMRAVRRLVHVAPILLGGAASMIGHAFTQSNPEARRLRVRARSRQLAASLLHALGVRITVAGPPPRGSALYASNHLGWLDVLVLLVVLPDCTLVAKRDVGAWPLLGTLARLGGTVLIDRDRKRDLSRAIPRLTDGLHAGQSVLLFAEGTTTDGTAVLPFKSSLFEAAVRADRTVVPIALCADTGPGGPDVRTHVCWWGEDTLLAHLPRVAGTRRITFTVRLGAPLNATADALTAEDAQVRRRARSAARKRLARLTRRAVCAQGGLPTAEPYQSVGT